MGKYLDILAREEVYDINDRNDQSPAPAVLVDQEAISAASRQ